MQSVVGAVITLYFFIIIASPASAVGPIVFTVLCCQSGRSMHVCCADKLKIKEKKKQAVKHSANSDC